MLPSLLLKQRKSLDHFFNQIDLTMLEKIIVQLQSCSGVIFFSGIGKSAHIAQKIAATCSSTGTRASFLCPVHALHGDMGALREGDFFFALSKSGETKELLELLPHIHKKRVRTIAATSRLQSTLSQQVELSLHLPVLEELCPLDLAPTTSSAIQLLMGDLLSIALMQQKQFSLSDFAANHPGGLLGQKITMKVSEMMLKGDLLPICGPNDCLMETLPLLSEKRSGCLLICDSNQKLLGIFTDGDLRRALQKEGSEALQKTLATLMTTHPLTIERHDLVLSAMDQMEEMSSKRITVLPVLEKGMLVGLLRMHDILQMNLTSR